MIDLAIELQVYLVDDDEVLLKAITQVYELENVPVVAIEDPVKLSKTIDRDFAGVVVTDVRMPKMDGIELFNKIVDIDPEIPVILITGHADVPMVLGALKDGAFSFFSKPIDSEHLLAVTHKALETRRLVLENRRLRELAEKATQTSKLIGETPVIKRLRSMVKQIAQTDIDILIEGETGTGKEVVAKMLHQLSDRSARPFVAVNCAAIPDDLAIVELFGSSYDSKMRSRGARIGKIEASHNGTLFLDEIQNLPQKIQAQLLPVIEERQVTPSIGDKPRDLNLRIIASSQTDLSAASENHGFREDLFYRINAIQLTIPPLRERREDIPLLFAHFISETAEKYSKDIPEVDSAVQRQLFEYEWPGNVRELKNFALSTVLGIRNPENEGSTVKLTLPEHVQRFEANTIRATLKQTMGDVRETLELLGIPRKTFYDKLSRHNIDINSYRS